MDEIEKKLRIAFYERNRYFANRIARTELHRAYTDQQARELMEQDQIQYVQIRLSSKHPKTDICDYHAKVDLYGLGPGVYPKAEAPKPPFHPHCYCLTAPRIDLIHPKPRLNPKAERAFLSSLPAKEAAQVAGSSAKLQQVLKGGTSLETLYNAGKDELYQWKRIGDILPATGNPSEATVSNTYEIAKAAGGKYHGWLKQQRALPIHLLEKAIRSFENLIADHQSWIEDPTRKTPNFYQLPIGQQKHLIEKHWPDDIQRHRDSIEILKGVIQEKKHGNQ